MLCNNYLSMTRTVNSNIQSLLTLWNLKEGKTLRYLQSAKCFIFCESWPGPWSCPLYNKKTYSLSLLWTSVVLIVSVIHLAHCFEVVILLTCMFLIWINPLRAIVTPSTHLDLPHNTSQVDVSQILINWLLLIVN